MVREAYAWRLLQQRAASGADKWRMDYSSRAAGDEFLSSLPWYNFWDPLDGRWLWDCPFCSMFLHRWKRHVLGFKHEKNVVRTWLLSVYIRALGDPPLKTEDKLWDDIVVADLGIAACA